MSENNIVYEITQMMRDKNNIQNDMSEAVNLVSKMFQDKYINKLNTAVQKQHSMSRENPPKEARLLQAMKPFIASHKHQEMDKLIDCLVMADTMKNIKKDVISTGNETSSISAASISTAPVIADMDESIHEDGIYDVDAACKGRVNAGGKAPAGGNGGLALLLLMTVLGR